MVPSLAWWPLGGLFKLPLQLHTLTLQLPDSAGQLSLVLADLGHSKCTQAHRPRSPAVHAVLLEIGTTEVPTIPKAKSTQKLLHWQP
jgi:hypothetical protein